MSNYERGRNIALDFEQASPLDLENAYKLLRETTPSHIAFTPSISMTESLRNSSAIPFNLVDSITIDSLPAEYDLEDNTIYPNTITLQVHGFYGDIDANERSLAYTLTHDEAGTYTGFVLQAFHDSKSYPLEATHSIPEFARTVAAHYNEYEDTVDHDQPGFSTDDFKRTAELRPLDMSDLDMMASILLQRSNL